MRIRGIDAGRRYSSQRQNSAALEMLLLFCCSSPGRSSVSASAPSYATWSCVFFCAKTSVHKFRALFGNCEFLCISCRRGLPARIRN